VSVAKKIAKIGFIALALFGLLAGLSLPVVQTASAQGEPERVAFDSDLVIKSDEVVHGDVSVTNGDLVVYGTVEGKATVVNGEADVFGKIQGDLAVLTGDGVTLHEGSRVGGNVLAAGTVDLKDGSTVVGSVTCFGGEVERDAGASVGGKINRVDNPAQAFGNLIRPGSQEARNGIHDAAVNALSMSPFERWAGLVFGLGTLSVLVLLLATGLSAILSSRVRTSSATLNLEPGPSVVVGIIAAFLLLPASAIVGMILMVSVVGIILLPVLAVIVAGAFLFGFVVVSHWVGKRLYETARQGSTNGAPTGNLAALQPQRLIVEVLLGATVILGSTLIPAAFLPSWISMLMVLMVYGVSCVGIGAGILSRFGTLAPPKRQHRHAVMYPTPHHEHYGSSLSHATAGVGGGMPERTNTRPLGPAPVLPREE
jgi:cytoskeletal protein CcmA (bactofilin family)